MIHELLRRLSGHSTQKFPGFVVETQAGLLSSLTLESLKGRRDLPEMYYEFAGQLAFANGYGQKDDVDPTPFYAIHYQLFVFLGGKPEIVCCRRKFELQRFFFSLHG